MSAAPVLVVCGTRPEVIKLAPVLAALRCQPALAPRLCASGQHRELLAQALAVFGLTPDHDLAVMQPAQEPAAVLARLLAALAPVLAAERPAAVVVQGDTSTACAAALAASYAGVPIAHVEAGLRSGRADQPFPEERQRRIITQLAAWHYAPTAHAAAALAREGVPAEAIVLSGNPVVDALRAVAGRDPAPPAAVGAPDGRRLVLVTGHRRERFGAGLAALCEALATIAARVPDAHVVFPVHPNPAVDAPVRARLAGVAGVTLTAPLAYPHFVAVLRRAHLVITDSGGVQEEAPTFAVPVLVTRDATDRPEALAAGCARLVGTGRDAIVAAALALLTDPAAHAAMRAAANPFGDGHAGARIAAHLAAALAARP